MTTEYICISQYKQNVIKAAEHREAWDTVKCSYVIKAFSATEALVSLPVARAEGECRLTAAALLFSTFTALLTLISCS
jgi:hypothetical protein